MDSVLNQRDDSVSDKHARNQMLEVINILCNFVY